MLDANWLERVFLKFIPVRPIPSENSRKNTSNLTKVPWFFSSDRKLMLFSFPLVSKFRPTKLKIDFDEVTLFEWLVGIKMDSIAFKFDSEEFSEYFRMSYRQEICFQKESYFR